MIIRKVSTFAYYCISRRIGRGKYYLFMYAGGRRRSLSTKLSTCLSQFCACHSAPADECSVESEFTQGKRTKLAILCTFVIVVVIVVRFRSQKHTVKGLIFFARNRHLPMSELLSPPPDAAGVPLTQTQKDLVGGSIGGIAQVLVGQVCCPFLAKVLWTD